MPVNQYALYSIYKIKRLKACVRAYLQAQKRLPNSSLRCGSCSVSCFKAAYRNDTLLPSLPSRP